MYSATGSAWSINKTTFAFNFGGNTYYIRYPRRCCNACVPNNPHKEFDLMTRKLDIKLHPESYAMYRHHPAQQTAELALNDDIQWISF